MLITVRLRMAVLLVCIIGLCCTQVSADEAKHVQNAPPDQQKNSSTDGKEAPTKETAPPDRGYIEGRSYKIAYLGLEFTAPEDLQFREPEEQSKPGSVQHSFAVSAWSKAHNRFSLQKYIVDEGIMFMAEPLASHSEDQRSDEGYMRFVSLVQTHDGFKRIGDASTEKIGDVKFLRTNFVQGKRNHTALVTTRKEYAFVFVFVSNDAGTINRLIESTTVKLP